MAPLLLIASMALVAAASGNPCAAKGEYVCPWDAWWNTGGAIISGYREETGTPSQTPSSEAPSSEAPETVASPPPSPSTPPRGTMENTYGRRSLLFGSFGMGDDLGAGAQAGGQSAQCCKCKDKKSAEWCANKFSQWGKGAEWRNDPQNWMLEGKKG